MTHNKIVLTSEQEQKIVSDYVSGKTLNETAALSGLKTNWVWRFLQRKGVQMRSGVEALRKLETNDDAFATLTEHSAYWAGFLMADGCVKKNSDNAFTISLELQPRDGQHVEAFRDFACPGAKVFVSKSGYYSVRCRSAKMANDLISLGVTPRKSLTAKASDVVAMSKHFWRGEVDGDGSVFFDGGYYKVSLCGSGPLMNQFADYCTTVIPNFRPTVRPVSSIFSVNISGRKAIMILKDLYGEATVALKRKWDVAKQAIIDEPKYVHDKPLIYSGQAVDPELIAHPRKQKQLVKFDGDIKPLKDMAKQYGISEVCLRGRLHRGMTPEAALTTPISSRGGDASKKRVTLDGETSTVKDFAGRYGIPVSKVYARMDLGWTIRQALELDPRPARVPWNKVQVHA